MDEVSASQGPGPSDSGEGTVPRSSGNAAIAWAWLFLTVSVMLVAVGFSVMFTYHGSHGQLVGGDAYNLMIIATRGVGFIAAGIVSALLGVGCLLTAVASRVSAQINIST